MKSNTAEDAKQHFKRMLEQEGRLNMFDIDYLVESRHDNIYERMVSYADQYATDYTSELRAELDEVKITAEALVYRNKELNAELEVVKAERDELKQSSPARFVGDDEIETMVKDYKAVIDGAKQFSWLSYHVGLIAMRTAIFSSPPEAIRTKEEILNKFERGLMADLGGSECYAIAIPDAIKAMQLYADQFRTVRSDQGGMEEILKDLEKFASEHIKTGGLRFYGVAWKDIVEVLAKHGVHQKMPF